MKIWNRWQKRHSNIYPDLRNVDLSATQLSFVQLPRADLYAANLRNTLLCNSNLRYTDLSHADLSYANLSHADLSHADLTSANLSDTNLYYANLNDAIFRETVLSNTNLSHALLRNTTFANVDLSTSIGLDTAYHHGSSTIGLDTLSRSKGNISAAFLRGVKVHENMLTSISESGIAAFDYFTCFISYASEDLVFAQKLHDALQREGVWCWFAPYSLRGGDYFRARIDRAIKQCDKLLFIFSQHSLASEWVRYEVELARQKERKHKSTGVIVPICLDTTLLDKPGWAAFISSKRHVRRFENWKQFHAYQQALQLLLLDLQMEE